MEMTVFDEKLKNLIHVCKETKNYKKLAVVSFILISNKLDEIGIYLGIRHRNKDLREKQFEYMGLINSIFESNLQLQIFPQSQIEILKECEVLFLRNKADIPLEYIKKIFKLYYDLRCLEVPNLNKKLNYENLLTSSESSFLSFLSPSSKRKQKDTGKLRPLIVQKIKEKEFALQRELGQEFNSQKLEKAIYLRALKGSIENHKSRKIIINGTLRQNLSYQKSIEDIYKYIILGIILLTLSLGLVILIEISYFPSNTVNLNSWALLLFGATAILVIVYLRNFRKVGV